jgi:hypothetical protein
MVGNELIDDRDIPVAQLGEYGKANCGLFVPYRRGTIQRFKLETRAFDDVAVARRAFNRRLCEVLHEFRFSLGRFICAPAGAEAPVYKVASAGAFTSSGASPQTAVGAGAVGVADMILLLVGWSCWLGGTAAAAGAPFRIGSSTFATNPPGTGSTTASPVQAANRVIAATNITGGVNWTTEHTVKTYVSTPADGQPFGGGLLFAETPDRSKALDFALASGPFIEVNTAAAVAETAEITIQRG